MKHTLRGRSCPHLTKGRWLDRTRTGLPVLSLLASATVSGAAAQADRVAPLRFTVHRVDSGLTGGYQTVVTDLNRDGRPDLIALAGGLGELRWYQNPGWQRHVLVAGIKDPINAAATDLDGDGIPEIALTHGFDTKYPASAGIVSILTHRGDPTAPWSNREIDRLPTSHRLRFADVEGNGTKVLVNAPLIGAGAEAPLYRARLPIVLYRPGAWRREPVTDAEEGVVHGLLATAWDGDSRHSILTAGFLGVHLHRLERGRWTRTRLTAGDPGGWPRSGASEIAVGRRGDGGERFLATIEPWHGDKVVIHRRTAGGWRRQVIDESITDGHGLEVGDFDGDGWDELVVAERGGKRGVYLYRLTDRAGDRWSRETLDGSGIGPAGCAVADLDGDRRPDVVCIGSIIEELRWYQNRP